jgi:hypothetical protein
MTKYLKIIIIIAIVVLVLCLAGFLVYKMYIAKLVKPAENSVLNSNSLADLSKVKDDDIKSLLSKNADSWEYIEKYKDFTIQEKEILTKESIVAGRSAENFKEIYQDLALENNRYVKVQLMDKSGGMGLIAVLDFKEKQVPKAYRLILFSGSVGQ